VSSSENENLSPVELEWRNADKDNSGTLSKREVRLLCVKLNLPPTTDRQFNAMFALYDKDESGELSREEFGLLYQSLISLPDVSDLFKQYCASDRMTSEELGKLVKIEMCNEEWSLEKLSWMIQEYEALAVQSTAIMRRLDFETLSMRGLACLLSDTSDNHPNKPANHDLTLPLSQYFINSSHNTYITGNQFSSLASTEAVRTALLNGVRVVELDVFDLNNSIVVSHKNSMVSKIAFEDCVRVIAESGFSKTEYPVILTLENHCSPEGQLRITEILRRVLGPMLYEHDWSEEEYETADETVDAAEGREESASQLPERQSTSSIFKKSSDENEAYAKGPMSWLSPQQLKRKVIIRDKAGKRIPELMKLCYIKNYPLKAKTDPKKGLILPTRDCMTSSSVEEGKLLSKLGVDGGPKVLFLPLLLFPATLPPPPWDEKKAQKIHSSN